MAIRDVRIYFYLEDKPKGIALSKDLWTDFNFYMDAVMRGRFQLYSGPEVKGVNIVNLKLFEPTYLQGHAGQELAEGWQRIHNTYVYETCFEFSLLPESKKDKLYTLVNTFTLYAKESELPQMRALALHTDQSIGEIDMDEVIEAAARYKTAHGVNL